MQVQAASTSGVRAALCAKWEEKIANMRTELRWDTAKCHFPAVECVPSIGLCRLHTFFSVWARWVSQKKCGRYFSSRSFSISCAMCRCRNRICSDAVNRLDASNAFHHLPIKIWIFRVYFIESVNREIDCHLPRSVVTEKDGVAPCSLRTHYPIFNLFNFILLTNFLI